MKTVDKKELLELTNENIEVLFEKLGIDLSNARFPDNKIVIPCPVHGGDKPSGFYYDYEYKNWTCWTRQCHEPDGTLYGLIRRLLDKKTGVAHTHCQVKSWIADTIGVKYDSNGNDIIVEINPIDGVLHVDKKIAKLNKECIVSSFKISIDEYIKRSVSDKYFSSMFKPETLDKFFIRYCSNRYKPMYHRSMVPILDNDGKFIIGITGRINLEKCPACDHIHYPNQKCYDDGGPRPMPKWLHSEVKTSEMLYNYSFAKNHIINREMIVVESPKNVWRLYEAGIRNVVALLGTSFSLHRCKLLMNAGVTKVFQIFDNDEAGQAGADKQTKMFGKYFTFDNLIKFLPKNTDISEADSSTLDIIKEKVTKTW